MNVEATLIVRGKLKTQAGGREAEIKERRGKDE